MDGYKVTKELIVPASKGNATVVEKGDLIEIIDVNFCYFLSIILMHFVIF